MFAREDYLMYVEEAKNELKRADHMIYVSLKYTRTCDIIRNVIRRLLDSAGFLILDVLEQLKLNGKIDSIPDSKLLRAEKLISLKRSFRDYLDLYFLMRKIYSSDFDRREEYRKNVTMIVEVDGEKLEVTVPILMGYFNKVKEFIDKVEAL